MSDMSFDQTAAEQLQVMSPPQVEPATMPETPPAPMPVAIPEGQTADIPVVPVADEEMRWGTVTRTLQSNKQPNFGPDYSFSYRPVAGMGANLTPAQQRHVKQSVRRSEMFDGTPVEYYTGEFLVNADGVIARPPYNPKKDTYDILYSLRPAQWRAVQQILVATGKYGDVRPYNKNITDRDQEVFSELLMSANVVGTTWDVALARLIARGGTFSGSGNQKYRSPMADPVKGVTDAVAERLGRQLTTGDVDTVVAALSPKPEQMGAVPGEQPVDEQAQRLVQTVDIFNQMLAER